MSHHRLRGHSRVGLALLFAIATCVAGCGNAALSPVSTPSWDALATPLGGNSSGCDLFGNPLGFISTSKGWYFNDSGMLYTTANQGVSWTPMSSPSSVDPGSVDFVNASDGWARVNGPHSILERTTNGGASWSQISNPSLYCLQFLSPSLGYAIAQTGKEGYIGALWWTTDGGVHWTKEGSASNDINSACFVSRQDGWTISSTGKGGSAVGTIESTTNGGKSWVRAYSSSSPENDMNLLGCAGKVAYASSFASRGSNGILSVVAITADAVDGRTTVAPLDSSTVGSHDTATWDAAISAVDIVSPTETILGVEQSAAGPPTIVVVTKGGTSVQPIALTSAMTGISSYYQGRINGISFTSSTDGWVDVSTSPAYARTSLPLPDTLLHTSNGGVSWTRSTLPGPI